jgi:hypothetical protein
MTGRVVARRDTTPPPAQRDVTLSRFFGYCVTDPAIGRSPDVDGTM